MLTVCWAVKGGSGTTVISCALALLTAAARESVWLVDLAGDVPAALGVAEPAGPGVSEWVSTPSAPLVALESLGVAAAAGLTLIPRGVVTAPYESSRWGELGQFLAADPRRFIVDGGSSPLPAQFVAAAQHSLLVIRPCYLALRRAVAAQLKPTGVVVVHEPGRALRADDVAHAVQTTVVAEVSTDPAVARAVDAGLLASRLPRTLAIALRDLVA